jgi:hypothetical protein
MSRYFLQHQELHKYLHITIFICGKTHFENNLKTVTIYIYFKVFFFRCYDMLAMLPRLKTAPPRQFHHI